MSIDSELSALSAPLSSDAPCGQDIEDTQLLASFDAYRIFGQSTALSADTDWRELKSASLVALETSKDVRLLTHLAAAALRLDGWPGFFGCVHVAATWMSDFWEQAYPKLEEDGILRKNALNGFSDRMGMIDAVRRTPFLEHRQLGRFSLRDVELATGQLAPTEADASPPTSAQLEAVLAATAVEELQPVAAGAATAIEELKAIEAAMRNFGGAAASPDFDPLIKLLFRIQQVVGDHLKQRVGTSSEQDADGSGVTSQSSSGGTVIAVGSIRSREDAIRAMDAAAAFFRQNEPSSPVPMFLERAKRLVGKDFLEVLADVAPEGMITARHAGGLKDE